MAGRRAKLTGNSLRPGSRVWRGRVYERSLACGAITAFVLASALVSTRPSSAQQRCLHGQDEARDQIARRQRALAATRQINNMEASTFGGTRAYQPLAQMAPVSILEAMLEGFRVHLATDGATYLFSIKDVLDPCGFACFSDEGGIIYTAQPIRQVGWRWEARECVR